MNFLFFMQHAITRVSSGPLQEDMVFVFFIRFWKQLQIWGSSCHLIQHSCMFSSKNLASEDSRRPLLEILYNSIDFQNWNNTALLREAKQCCFAKQSSVASWSKAVLLREAKQCKMKVTCTHTHTDILIYRDAPYIVRGVWKCQTIMMSLTYNVKPKKM